jgi:hypothetical protein
MEIVDVAYLGSDGQYQTYSPSDTSLINAALITSNFGLPDDYIEYFIKDVAGTVLNSNYYTTKYNLGSDINPITGTTTKLYLNPEADAKESGYNRGIVNVKYNFFRKYLLSTPDPSQNFWIKEVSTSRTEIKVARQDLSNDQLANAFTEFNAALAADAYYPDFLLNFGIDRQVIAVNAVYVEEDGNGYVIFKLYEPLPLEFDVKSTFWVVTQVADSAEFNVSINVEPEVVVDFVPIKGPNFKVQVNDKVGQTTPYYTYESLLLTSITSSYQQLQSMMQEKGIQINVDYSNFENFIHFSSATERLYNFVYKVQLIESASVGLAQPNTDTAKVILQAQIDSIITNFDGYEYYLYFTSASTAWPKQQQTAPYTLYSVTSSQAISWLGSPTTSPTATTMSMYSSASYYDNQNKDILIKSIPAYLTDDSGNQPYLVFLNMIGQHFDNIWIYLKDVTNHYSAENNPFVGISMDQVGDALRSFGIQLYTNTSITDNIYYSLLGVNQTGSNLPVTSSQYAVVDYGNSSLLPLVGNAYLTASTHLPPFGDEKINRYVTTFVTGSPNITSSFDTLPASQLTGEIYKRLYHNLPYLLKTRGTERGIKALIATYGIPSDILTVHEYGGYNYLEVPGIQEISNTRILTGSVLEISSSLLSPNTTLQYYSNDLENTSINVEVAFSPADSINASITSSGYVTSSTQPGYFNIMQLIGAPNLQYSSSYIPLVDLSNTYFNAEYTSRYNVWDFIRVIKYYNNSLFKMLRDWVPARTSPSTGIVIKSHMLERNKYPRHEPTATTSSIDADYELAFLSGSDGGSVIGSTSYVEAIPLQYNGTASAAFSGSPGTIYMNSTDGIQKYTGEFSGSTIQAATNTFSQIDISSYVYPRTSSVAPSDHGGQNIMFLTYSISPIYQNIYQPVKSQRFLDLDYNSSQTQPVNYGLITQSLSQSLVIGNVLQSQDPYSQYAYIQDYNYNLRPSVIQKYSGSKVSGKAYNVYSAGDQSYGNDPIINYYSDKLGLFTQVATSSFLPGKVNASLGYLADVSGGLFELNQKNKHWQDVQNIFKAGTTLTIKQFDNKKYSNQKSTDGIKRIYSSGYSYTPELYFATGSDAKLYFEFVGEDAVAGGFIANNSSSNYISGSPTGINNYLPTVGSGYIYNIFDSIQTNPANEYATGSKATTTFPTYTPAQAGIKTFTATFDIYTQVATIDQDVTYSFDIKNGATVLNNQTIQFRSTQSAGQNSRLYLSTYGGGSYGVYNSGSSYALPSILQPNLTFPIDVYNKSTNTYITTVTSGQGLDLGLYDIIDAVTGLPIATGLTGIYNTSNLSLQTVYYGDNGYFLNFTDTFAAIPTTDTLNTTSSFNVQTSATSIAPGDDVTFEFKQLSTTTNITASVTPGSLTVKTTSVGQGGYPYALSTNPTPGPFINSITSSLIQSEIVLNTSLSSYLGYQFVPYFVSGGVTYSSSLYNRYGDVNTPFYPENGDIIVVSDFNGITQDVTVLSASLQPSDNMLHITVVPALLSSWTNNPTLILEFLLLKRYKDEQNVIMTFNKNPGATSYGFIIPETINPTVLAEINTLQAAVQTQLLSNQSNTG